ncbi:MAG: TetR/AcrR family transcriptional regulator [Thermoguttaceae bacterium]|jgi:AcrR family transcriptional regulator
MTTKKKRVDVKAPHAGKTSTPSAPDDNALFIRKLMSATPGRGVAAPIVPRIPKEELARLPLRQRLILAAIDEVEKVGFGDFSMRRVANACGASCAAPYKHFKNRKELFVAILDYITDVWLERQKKTLERHASDSLRTQLVELALEYLKFVVENPQFRTILMIQDQTFDESFLHIKARISDYSKELILKYCAEQKIDPRVARVKMYVVRSFLYGFAIMFGNNELPYNDQMTRFIRALIQREIELPWTEGFSQEDLAHEAGLIEFLTTLGPDVPNLDLKLKNGHAAPQGNEK